MDAKIHGNLRVLEIEVGGVFVINAEGLESEVKSHTSPLGLTLWADKVIDRW